MAKVINDSNFAEETASGVVLIDFYADWCGPCQMIMPVVEELAAEYEGKAKIFKVNVDESPETAQKFGVMSIPTFALMKDGEVVDTKMGALPKDALIDLIESAL